jgi:hypothetical protein
MMRADAWLRVQTTQIFWNVGDSATEHDWVAGTGELIEQAWIRMVEESSVEIWQKILDYDDEGQA